jgi:hypothetical protein
MRSPSSFRQPPAVPVPDPQGLATVGGCPDPKAPGFAPGDPAETEATLNALVATGMPRWDAGVALLALGAPKRCVFPDLAGVPDAFVMDLPDPNLAFKLFRDLGEVDSAAGNAVVNAYFAGRTVEGDLRLYFQDWLTHLPAGLVVRGSLDLSKATLVRLPDDLRVDGSLDLQQSSIEEVPAGLKVGGSLNLWETRIAELPDGLRVGRDLDLECSDLQALPRDLRVGGDLNLRHCKGWDGVIPGDIQVGGLVFTDPQGNGCTLQEWRASQRSGEVQP